MESRSTPIEGVAYRGWRMWRLREGRLLSVTNDTPWLPGVAVAASKRDPRILVAQAVICFCALSCALFIGFWIDIALIKNSLDLELFDLRRHIVLIMLPFPLAILWFLLAHYHRHSGKNGFGALVPGRTVAPGMYTPGIYTMGSPDAVEWPPALKPLLGVGAFLRGEVDIWGDTIIHERGAKGEYAYVSRLTDVACMGCDEWIPIREWSDEEPPAHDHCPDLDPGARTRPWEPAGLATLREAAPEWFPDEPAKVAAT